LRAIVPTKQKKRRTQARRREEMRRRLLDAAIALLIERGYSGFRVAEVANVAQVSRGGQLHHFRTKDSMVLAALEELYRRSDRVTERNLARAAGAPALQALAEDGQQFFFGANFLASVDVLMSAAKDPALARKVKQIAYRHRVRIEENWARHVAASGIPLGVARDIVWLVQAVYRGLVFRTRVRHSAEQVKRVERLLSGLVEGFLERKAWLR
jgi:AcrR family transcriptional regulator